jgi:hypothetical protein
MGQVEELNPPPNPAKQTDKRYMAYAATYGPESWELDALPPEYMAGLVERTIRQFIDWAAWRETEEEIESVKAKLLSVASGF